MVSDGSSNLIIAIDSPLVTTVNAFHLVVGLSSYRLHLHQVVKQTYTGSYFQLLAQAVAGKPCKWTFSTWLFKEKIAYGSFANNQ